MMDIMDAGLDTHRGNKRVREMAVPVEQDE
jgi:hypothetical protein